MWLAVARVRCADASPPINALPAGRRATRPSKSRHFQLNPLAAADQPRHGHRLALTRMLRHSCWVAPRHRDAFDTQRLGSQLSITLVDARSQAVWVCECRHLSTRLPASDSRLWRLHTNWMKDEVCATSSQRTNVLAKTERRGPSPGGESEKRVAPSCEYLAIGAVVRARRCFSSRSSDRGALLTPGKRRFSSTQDEAVPSWEHAGSDLEGDSQV